MMMMPGLSGASSIMSILRCFVFSLLFTYYIISLKNIICVSQSRVMCFTIISMFPPIGHSDHKNIIELVHSVNLGEKLVDNGVIDPRTLATAGASRLADRVNLVKDDDVQACKDDDDDDAMVMVMMCRPAKIAIVLLIT